MPVDLSLLRSAGEQMRAADRVFVICHMRPDGDAIGSLLGLGLALESTGKSVQMISVDGVPASLSHLKGADRVKSKPGLRLQAFQPVLFQPHVVGVA